MIRDDFTPIDLPPGLWKNGTVYQAKSRWTDGNLVRWVNGQLRPVGGWHSVSASTVTGKARDMLSWSDSAGDRWIAVGTSSNLYVTRGDGTLYDITPAGFTGGNDDAVESLGYGGNNYGSSTYGTPRDGGSYVPLAVWSLDNWGEWLVGCARSDGRIVQWELNTASDATVTVNAPVDCVGVLVTDQRHVLALGAGGDGTRIEWSDKEDIEVWAAAADNEAGGFNLAARSAIKAGVRVNGINLIITSTDAHAVQYVGAPFIYGRERIGDDCGILSPGAVISVGKAAFWMGNGTFWTSDGVGVAPIDCEVAAYVFGSLNSVQAEKVAAGHNPDFGEVWWFYPSTGSTENDRAVIYNYREGWWSVASLARTCWDSGAVFGFPHAVGTTGLLYRHEDDWTDDGAVRFQDIYAESGVLEVGAGARIGHVDQIIPDEETAGEVTVTFKTRFTPEGDEFTYGPYTVRADGYMDVRFAGRQAIMRVEPIADGDFTIGSFRLNVHTRGRR